VVIGSSGETFFFPGAGKKKGCPVTEQPPKGLSKYIIQ